MPSRARRLLLGCEDCACFVRLPEEGKEIGPDDPGVCMGMYVNLGVAETQSPWVAVPAVDGPHPDLSASAFWTFPFGSTQLQLLKPRAVLKETLSPKRSSVHSWQTASLTSLFFPIPQPPFLSPLPGTQRYFGLLHSPTLFQSSLLMYHAGVLLP